MTNPLDRRILWLALAALLIGSIGTCLLGACSKSSNANISADDGWRRTEHGWERVAGWQTQASAASSIPLSPTPPPPKTSNRWDTHPAALALLQLAIVLFALLRMPNAGQVIARGRAGGLRQSIAKSFRASAFG